MCKAQAWGTALGQTVYDYGMPPGSRSFLSEAQALPGGMRRSALAIGLLMACAPPPPVPSEPASRSEPVTDQDLAVAEPDPAPDAEVATEAEAPVAGLPSKRQATAASRALLKGKLAQLAPIFALSDARAAVVWRHTEGEYACEASVHLVVLRREGETWVAEGQKGLIDASTPWIADDEPPPLAVTARSEDYDDDGEPEVLVRVRHPVMCPGGGPNTITSMFIYDVTPSLGRALVTELHHTMEANDEASTRASVEHVDLDGDGHRDVQIDYVFKDEETTERTTNRWIYSVDEDVWTLTKPEYQRWDCDW